MGKEDTFKGMKFVSILTFRQSLSANVQPVANADFVVPIEIENQLHHVYVLKRPHVDTFLKRMGELFEVVLFTASLSKVWASPFALTGLFFFEKTLLTWYSRG